MELKPCPFCGSEANITRIGNQHQSCIIECGNCGCKLENGETEEQCGKKWNTRPSHNFKPCLCPKSEAKTVKLITSQIWQCPTNVTKGQTMKPREIIQAIDEMLGGHYNLYKCEFGETSDPEDDICRKRLKEAREAIVLLTSGKVKEPHWPEKIITHSETHILLGTYHLTQEICSACDSYGYNKAIDACKQAWKDAQEK